MQSGQTRYLCLEESKRVSIFSNRFLRKQCNFVVEDLIKLLIKHRNKIIWSKLELLNFSLGVIIIVRLLNNQLNVRKLTKEAYNYLV